MTYSQRVAALIVWCIALRLALWGLTGMWSPEGQMGVLTAGDPQDYHQFALRLLAGEGFSHPEDAPRLEGHLSRWYPGELEALWLPGYPAFLAFFYRVFGVHPGWVLVVQILFSGLACFWLMSAAYRVFGERAALWVGALFAHEPVSIWLANSILSEAIAIPVMAWCMLAWARIVSSTTTPQRVSWVVGLSAGLAAGVWLRPGAAAYAWPLFLLLFFWAIREGLGVRQAVQMVALGFALYYLLLTPWYWRNWQAFGTWSLSTAGAYNWLEGYKFAKSTSEAVKAEDMRIFQEAYQKAVQAGSDPERLNPFERARFWRQLAGDYFRANPLGTVRLHLWRIFAAATQGGQAQWRRLFEAGVLGETRLTSLLTQTAAVYTRLYAIAFWLVCIVGIVLLTRLASPAARWYGIAAVLTAAFSFAILVNNPVPRSRIIALLWLMPVAAVALTRSSSHSVSRDSVP